jgi:hypothetical protein
MKTFASSTLLAASVAAYSRYVDPENPGYVKSKNAIKTHPGKPLLQLGDVPKEMLWNNADVDIVNE